MVALISPCNPLCASQLESVYGEICELALEHIHANEVILTYGRSRTIENFLKVRIFERFFEYKALYIHNQNLKVRTFEYKALSMPCIYTMIWWGYARAPRMRV